MGTLRSKLKWVGNVFTSETFKSRRVEKEEFLVIKETIIELFKEYNIDLYFGKYTKNKESFGDLDIIVSNEHTQDCIDILNYEQFKSSKNSNVLSFLYEDFQIDLIFVNPEILPYAVEYYSWNDIHNLIGKLAKKAGFKHGQNGLEYVIRDQSLNSDGRLLDEIFLSNDPYLILKILELDVDRYKAGFENVTEMFEYVATSPYFNPHFYQLSELTNKDRVRDRKRVNFQLFLDWCETLEMDLDDKFIISKEHRYILPHIWFTSLPDKVRQVYKEKARLDFIKSKFNGSLIMTWIPRLKGKELGQFMFYCRETLTDEFIFLATENEIRLSVLEMFAKWIPNE